MEYHEQISKECERHYRFASLVNNIVYQLFDVPELKPNLSYLICVNQFATHLASYSFSVFEDIKTNPSNFLIKAETNRVVLRGCLEAVLINEILIQNPKLQSAFFHNLDDDIKRINKIYNNSSKNRNRFYSAFNEEEEMDNEKFAKRYAWLPKKKKRRANSMKDLLQYIDGLDEFDRNYYELLIRALDLYAHPSFYLSNLLDHSKEGNVSLVDIIFKKDGVIDQLTESVIDSFAFIEETCPQFKIKDTLSKALHAKEEAFNIASLNIKEFNASVLGQNKIYSTEQIMYYVSRRYNLEYNLQHLEGILPKQIHELSYAIKTISTILDTYFTKNFKNLTIIKLLNDLYPRYDDLIIAYFRSDYAGFYASCRYLIEAIATLYIVFNEEEERSHIYFIHQDIKGYEFQQVSAEFSMKAMPNSEDYEKKLKSNEVEFNNNLQLVKEYYRKYHHAEVDDSLCKRLNGWALFLKDTNSERIPNAPALIEYAVTRLAKFLPEILTININFIDFTQGLYEESCAYSHITSYAWYNTFYALQENTILKQQFIVCNVLINLIVNHITDGYEIEQVIPEEMFDKLDNNFNVAMSKLILNYLK